MSKRRIILTNPEKQLHQIADFTQGKSSGVKLGSRDFGILPYDIPPPPKMKWPVNPKSGEKFPNCCPRHKNYYTLAKNWFAKFPNCCQEHSMLSSQIWFDKKQHGDMASKIVNQIAYTEDIVESSLDKKDWYERIIDYIELNIFSFGQPPEGFGGVPGLHIYLDGICSLFELKITAARPEQQEAILQYIVGKYKTDGNETNRNETNLKEDSDFIALIEIYKRWLSIFPFDLPPFKHLKNKVKKMPLFESPPKKNRYTGFISGKPINQQRLIKMLLSTTKEILKSANTVELVKTGKLEEPKQRHWEITNEHHRVKQQKLLDEYGEDELSYVDTIEQWLLNEKEYINEIKDIYFQKDTQEVTKRQRIAKALSKYGFFELEMVKNLSHEGQAFILNRLSQKNTPYNIALLDHIGFFDHMHDLHTETKSRMHKIVSKCLEIDKSGRTVRGHLNSLNPKSTEDQGRYTAFKYKETVKKDYQNLK